MPKSTRMTHKGHLVAKLALPERDKKPTGNNQSSPNQHLNARQCPKCRKSYHLPHAKQGGYVQPDHTLKRDGSEIQERAISE
jgi:hypothetical protein